VVLDALKRSPVPVLEPHEILFRKLRELKQRGYLRVTGAGTGRFGLALEKSLGIPPNSHKGPDFMGIELKTKSSNSLQTLFSRVPTCFTGTASKASLLKDHGYEDQARNRRALYTSFNCETDSLGFQLKTKGDRVVVQKGGIELLEYDAGVLEAALLSKHSQTAYVGLSVRKQGSREVWRVETALYCKWPSIIRFLRLVDAGSIFLDFTLSQKSGKVRDHGFLWRIQKEALPILYLKTQEKNLEET